MWKERTRTLIGEKAVEKLNNSRVAVFGVGGVGSYAVEALVRSGVGSIDLIDGDEYCETNLNRQLYATLKTLGVKKPLAAMEHIKQINPDCNVKAFCLRFSEATKECFDFDKYDYVIDAIDSIDCKTLLITYCTERNIPIISSMGAGNRTAPQAFRIVDIYKTANDPLAKEMRKRLKAAGVKKLLTVCSDELPHKAKEGRVIGSMCCVTAAAGMLLASNVINNLVERVEL